MHFSLKYGIAAAAGTAGLEYLYTTAWYQGSQFAAVGSATGIIFDMGVAAVVAIGVGVLLH